MLERKQKRKQTLFLTSAQNPFRFFNQTGFEKGSADEVISTSKVDKKHKNSNKTSIILLILWLSACSNPSTDSQKPQDPVLKPPPITQPVSDPVPVPPPVSPSESTFSIGPSTEESVITSPAKAETQADTQAPAQVSALASALKVSPNTGDSAGEGTSSPVGTSVNTGTSASAGTVVSANTGPKAGASTSQPLVESENEVCAFPAEIKQAVEKSLGKPCSAIPIDKLSAIKSLNVSHTGISDLGPQISHLENLETLNISHTQIQNLGPELCQLKNLTTLKASHNKYEGNEMPIAIVCLSELKNLDLSYSSLQYIDEYIYYLKNLKNLNLRGNKLTSTPMLFGLMSSLVTLDLRDNQFEYKSVNSLSDCSSFKENSKERKNCQEDLLEKVKCEYWYELPEDCSQLEDDLEQKAKCEKAKFKRGQLGNQSFIKRYEEMTGEEHIEREDDLTAARCYFYWINHYVLFGNPDDPLKDPETDSKKLEQKQAYLLDLTINGKTLRELRLAQDELVKAGGYGRCHFYAKGVSFRDTEEVWSENMDTNLLPSIPWFSRLIYHSVTDFGLSLWRGLIMPRDTSYGPSTHEIYPERHRSPHWNQLPRKRQYKEDTEAFCRPIDFNTPIPSGPLGPWSKALPSVQTLIEEKYLEPGWDECEKWPTGVCHDWEERLEKGQNPGGFLFR